MYTVDSARDNFGDVFAQTIRGSWDFPAFTEYEGATITFGEVAQRVARLHILFEAAGVRQGDRIAVLGRNSTNWGTTFIATLTYGAVVVPVLHEFKTQMIHHIVEHSKAKLLMVGDAIWENLNEAAMPSVAAIVSLDSWRCLHVGAEAAVATQLARVDEIFAARYPEGVRPDDLKYHKGQGEELAEINYTSGTSGFSKGVMLPYRSLLSNLEFACGVVDVRPRDTVICVLPMAHAYGQAFEFLYCLMRGAHLHFLTRMPTPKVIVKAFGDVRPRIVMLVPLIVEKIYKTHIRRQLSKPGVRLMMNLPILDKQVKKRFNEALTDLFGGQFLEVIIGGAGLNAEVERFLKRVGFRFTVGYGMTECGPIITYANWAENRLGSAGRAVVNMEVRIDAPDPQTGVGEVQVRGTNVMLGYYKNAEATREAFTDDGWLRTGDLGMLDSEGFLYIKGRSKNMILGPSGQNIYPEEIEGLINTLPYVQESLVVQQDGRLVALVVPDFAQIDSEGMSHEQVEALMEEGRVQINQELPQYSQLAAMTMYPEEFEKTPKRSIKRFLYLTK